MTPKARPVTGLVFVVVYDAVGQACDWLGFRCDWWRHRQGLWLLNGWAFASQFWFIVMFSDVNFSKQERNSFDQVDHNLEWLSSNPNQPRQQKNFSLLAPSSMQQQLQPRKRLHHISSSYQNYFDSWLFFVAVVVGSDFIPLIDVIKFLIFCLSSGTDFSSLLLSLAVILFHWSMWLSSSCSAWAREHDAATRIFLLLGQDQ